MVPYSVQYNGLLSGVGVLFIPFVGSVVAAGPIGAALLGAASGAIAGSAGGGLASFLTTLGMSEEKAAIYETRLQAGEFIVMTEVPADKSGEIQLLLESAGGEEIHTSDMTLPRPCPGRCNGTEDLSPEVQNHLSLEAQKVFIELVEVPAPPSFHAGDVERGRAKRPQFMVKFNCQYKTLKPTGGLSESVRPNLESASRKEISLRPLLANGVSLGTRQL